MKGYSFESADLLTIPCGRCLECRLKKTRDWAVRCMHEAQLWDHSYFVTLTMDDVSVESRRNLWPTPSPWSVDVRDWQRFAKRLRKLHPGFRFLASGEYGGESLRPHYHACIFNLPLKDLMHWKTVNGNPLYLSPTIAKVWPFGIHSIGQVTFESAAYVAKYTIKKRSGAQFASHYERVDPSTGECWQVKPEFAVMSRRPGLAARWLDKYSSDVFPSDEVIVNGRQFKPPLYYMRDLEVFNPKLAEDLKVKRKAFADLRPEENSVRRRKARGEVVAAKIALRKGALET